MKGSTTHRRRVATRALLGALAAFAGCLAIADEDPATLPTAVPPAPRVPGYDSSYMATEAQALAGCDTAIEEGWSLVNPDDGAYFARRIEGQVVESHAPHGDFGLNHNTEDFNVFVYLDNQNPLANNPAANYWSYIGYGQWASDVPKEHGLFEIEWEYGAHSWNDAASSDYYGFPSWAWPSIGDRVLVEGYWIYDCGHEPYHTEIHPPWMVVTYRNTAQDAFARGSSRKGTFAALGPDDRDMSPVTRADVFISSYGGEAVDNIFYDEDFYGPDLDPPMPDWWQPVNSKDYDFDILAPEKPAGDPPLVIKILNPPSDYVEPPNAVHPPFDMSNLTTFVRPDGRTAVHVHIPFTQVSNSAYMVFAKSIVVGWDVKEPDVELYRVELQRWYDAWDYESGPADYSAWLHTGGQHAFVRVSDGVPDEGDPPEYDCDSDFNYTPQCDIGYEENNYATGYIDQFVGPDDTLVVSFRTKELDIVLDDPTEENDDVGIAQQAFTADDSFGLGSHLLNQSDTTFTGAHHDAARDGLQDPFFDWCDYYILGGPCYAVSYHIAKIMADTEIEVGVPPVQYAMDPSHYTATVFTPGSPVKPRRRLPVEVWLHQGIEVSQILNGTSSDDGVAAPTDVITLPAGTYENRSSWPGNGLLYGTVEMVDVVIEKDYTATGFDTTEELRWGHRDPMTVTLIEPNIGQDEPSLPIPDKNLVVTFTGLTATETYVAGPTQADGTATITPLMLLPPGNYQVTACFEEDPWFRASCSAPKTVKVTPGFAAFARVGPISISGGSLDVLGDLHSETGVNLSGTGHIVSAGADERLEYVTSFTDNSTGSTYNDVQVAPFFAAPQYLASTYCGGASALMGVPITYVPGNWNIKHDTVLSGIYCVSGDVKIQARVTGTATIVATGVIDKIRTTGGDQSLATADPTGADLLMLAGATGERAITLVPTDAVWKGVVVSMGGLEVGGQTSRLEGSFIGNLLQLKGSDNVVDGR